MSRRWAPNLRQGHIQTLFNGLAGHARRRRQRIFQRALAARPKLPFSQSHIGLGGKCAKFRTAAHDAGGHLARIHQGAFFARPLLIVRENIIYP